MGYVTCSGGGSKPVHRARRACWRCDRCPTCDGVRLNRDDYCRECAAEIAGQTSAIGEEMARVDAREAAPMFKAVGVLELEECPSCRQVRIVSRDGSAMLLDCDACRA